MPRRDLLLVSCLLLFSQAWAVPIRYEFSGQFSFDTPEPFPEIPTIPVLVRAGAQFNGFFEFDPTQNADSSPAPDLGLYQSALLGMGVDFAGTSLRFVDPRRSIHSSPSQTIAGRPARCSTAWPPRRQDSAWTTLCRQARTGS